jgi:hypothetical protein
MIGEFNLSKIDGYERLVGELRRLAPELAPSKDRVREPALRVIDCVLSLNRWYEGFVLPRLNAFEEQCPNVRSFKRFKNRNATSFFAGRVCAPNAEL